VEFLKVDGPIIMVVIFQLSLQLHEFHRSTVNVDDCFPYGNIIFQLLKILENGANILIISAVFSNHVRECLNVTGHPNVHDV
jgi:hypothetical protein